MPDGTLEERLEVVKALLAAFRVERMVYLAVTFASLAILLACAVAVMWKSGGAEIEGGLAVGLFGSSGVITFTAGRILKMYSDALGRVLPLGSKVDEP
jgi:hypothetical protein